jgi:hypothetical protein
MEDSACIRLIKPSLARRKDKSETVIVAVGYWPIRCNKADAIALGFTLGGKKPVVIERDAGCRRPVGRPTVDRN